MNQTPDQNHAPHEKPSYETQAAALAELQAEQEGYLLASGAAQAALASAREQGINIPDDSDSHFTVFVRTFPDDEIKPQSERHDIRQTGIRISFKDPSVRSHPRVQVLPSRFEIPVSDFDTTVAVRAAGTVAVEGTSPEVHDHAYRELVSSMQPNAVFSSDQTMLVRNLAQDLREQKSVGVIPDYDESQASILAYGPQ